MKSRYTVIWTLQVFTTKLFSMQCIYMYIYIFSVFFSSFVLQLSCRNVFQIIMSIHWYALLKQKWLISNYHAIHLLNQHTNIIFNLCCLSVDKKIDSMRWATREQNCRVHAVRMNRISILTISTIYFIVIERCVEIFILSFSRNRRQIKKKWKKIEIYSTWWSIFHCMQIFLFRVTLYFGFSCYNLP